MISRRVRTSHARKNETTPITPSQSDRISRERCHERLVVSGFDSSTETRSNASCSFFASTISLLLRATELYSRRGTTVKARALGGSKISDLEFHMAKFHSFRDSIRI